MSSVAMTKRSAGYVVPASEWNQLIDNDEACAAALMTAKGDWFLGTGSRAGTKLTVGTNGTIPLADSSQTAGVQWAGVLPNTWTCFHNESLVVTGNAMYLNYQTSQIYAMTAYQNAAANGDVWKHGFCLTAGTYTLAVLGVTANNCGKVDLYIDDVAITTGQDWYSSGTTYNVIKAVTSISITSGKHVLKGIANGKNGSSGGYYLILTSMYFYPTAGY